MGRLALSARLDTISAMAHVSPATMDALNASTRAPRPALSVIKITFWKKIHASFATICFPLVLIRSLQEEQDVELAIFIKDFSARAATMAAQYALMKDQRAA